MVNSSKQRKSKKKVAPSTDTLKLQKLGVESLETRLSLAASTLSPLAQYYLAWYQSQLRGNTNTNTNIPPTGPFDNSSTTGPKNMSAVAPATIKQINLSWTAATATTGSLTLERSTDNVTFGSIGTLGLNTTSYSDSNVTEGVTYYYRLRMTGSSLVNTSASATTTVLNATGLGANPNSDGSVTLGWGDNSAVNTGYQVQRSTNGVNFSTIATIGGNATSYVDNTTAKSTTYFYRLIANTNGGTLTPTLSVQVTTVAPPPPVVVPDPKPTPTPNPTPTTDPKLQVVFGNGGLTKLAYDGVTIYDPANGIGKTGGIISYGSYDANGNVITAPTSVGPVLSSSWDASTNTYTQNYLRFKFSTTFTINGSNLDVSAKVTYTGATPISGVIAVPFTFNFPKVPTGFSGNPKVDVTSSGVVAITADYGTGKVTIVGKDVSQTEIVGWQGMGGQSGNYTSYGVRFGSVGVAESNWAIFDNKLTTGQSTTMNVSIRFTKAGGDTSHIADDVSQAFGQANPYKLQWSDRRMIATIFPAGAQATSRTAKNPNGWLNDPTIDVTTTAGLDAFYNKMMKYADDAITKMKAANAQGGILWDIEGERYQEITYVGDPRLIPTLAPELEYKGLIDTFMKKFTDAGLKIGMTIRPQHVVWVNDHYEQHWATDQAQELMDKINYAKNRWGATLFYIDSNDADDVAQIAKVQAAFPDVLLIPENPGPALYAYGAGYRELRGGYTGTVDEVKAIYPEAFSAIWVNDASQAAKTAGRADLIQSVKEGDILLVHFWDMSFGVDIYKAAGLQ